jgi:glutamyl-tRNA synthetase
MEVRTRIAPSPTGEDLHIGNLYTALINWAYAKKNSGKFVVRIEDTDRERYVEGAEKTILSSINAFGLVPDESPEAGGPYEPYRQSERLDLYKGYADELLTLGLAYKCFCSKERLEEIRTKEAADRTKKKHREYCDLNATGEKFVIRLKVPENEDISFDDLIRGKITINSRELDDQVLLKSDGYPTYHLGVVVDDYSMKISHVIRAEEWISSTPKHVLLYKAFGWELPVFVHLPILRNSDKSKLSKRKNPVWVSWYLKDGYLPEAILNYLALMGWSHPEQKEIFPVEEFIEKLELKDFSPVGPAFDQTKLDWMNGEYIRKMTDEQLADRLEDYLKQVDLIAKNIPSKETLLKLVPLVKERIKKLSDFIPLTDFFFGKPEYDISVFNKLKIEDMKLALNKVSEKLAGLKSL